MLGGGLSCCLSAIVFCLYKQQQGTNDPQNSPIELQHVHDRVNRVKSTSTSTNHNGETKVTRYASIVGNDLIHDTMSQSRSPSGLDITYARPENKRMTESDMHELASLQEGDDHSHDSDAYSEKHH